MDVFGDSFLPASVRAFIISSFSKRTLRFSEANNSPRLCSCRGGGVGSGVSFQPQLLASWPPGLGVRTSDEQMHRQTKNKLQCHVHGAHGRRCFDSPRWARGEKEQGSE